MKLKLKVKLLIDVLMTLILLFLMGYQFWGSGLHEWAGAIMLVLFITHNILNWNWYKSLFKGQHNAIRCLQIIINLLLLIVMLLLMASGIIMSRYVFTFIDLSTMIPMGRIMHIACSHWGFILMALHIGIHWGMITTMIKKHVKVSFNETINYIIKFFVIGYGVYVFIKRNFLTYMLLQSQFMFMDFNESKLLFYFDYILLMGLFLILTHQLVKILRTNN